MEVEMNIIFEEKIETSKLNTFIKELNNETMKIDEDLGEMRTFKETSQAMPLDPIIKQLLIAVLAPIFTDYIREKSPVAKKYAKKMFKKVFEKMKKLTNKSKIVIKKAGEEIMTLLEGTDEEFDKAVRILSLE
ncbi:hypothetical protein CEE45_11045 [Candidatus Heimdallarchaeota archaeon B3_Heim]|nr:MAG: hypothetical protein CEE45_11045 [Candidatus Heimdallarchaeota archaeon B3_Heim]